MINSLRNACNYIKYGKIIHKSPNGNTIRSKTTYPGMFDTRNGHKESVKTILDKNNNIVRQLERKSYSDNDVTTTTVKPILYSSTGQKLNSTEQPRTKTYLVQKHQKVLTDNTKPGYDYKYEKLPDGKTEYEIAYPEMTIIDKKKGTVRTLTESKKYVE